MELTYQSPKYGAAIALTAGLSLALSATGAWAKPNGKPFQEIDAALQLLNDRVSELEISVDQLEQDSGAETISVDCDNGESLAGAFSPYANGTTPLTINVAGICNERLTVARSNVTIQGTAPGTEIVNPSMQSWTIVAHQGAGNVLLRDITIRNGLGVVSSQSASLELENVTVSGAATGSVAAYGGYLGVTGSQIENSAYGILVTGNGAASVSDSVIENNTIGVLAFKGGNATITSALPNGTNGNGVTIQNNNSGVLVYTGAVVDLTDATVQNSTGVGVYARALGTLHVSPSRNGQGTHINSNGTVGIYAIKGANLFFSDPQSQISFNQFGIICEDNPIYIVDNGPSGPNGLPATMTGNTVAPIIGCTP